jgi:hypothetical protein
MVHGKEYPMSNDARTSAASRGREVRAAPVQLQEADAREAPDRARGAAPATVPEQGAWLASVVRGYFAYHAVPNNGRRLASFRYQVVRAWHRALNQPPGPARLHDWERMHQLDERWIPKTRILRPWPEGRFDVRTTFPTAIDPAGPRRASQARVGRARHVAL